MSPRWLLWYALRVGLSYDTAMAQPVGLIIDLMRIEQIKHERAKAAQSFFDDEDIIPDAI